MLAIFHFRNDIPKSMKTASEMAALLEVALDLTLCKWNNNEMQVNSIQKQNRYLIDDVKIIVTIIITKFLSISRF